ncbi:hypothetical protein D3C86_1816670 [compost metagenome]
MPIKAIKSPRNAPETILGANTPPSPPAPSVRDAAKGFKIAIINKKRIEMFGVVIDSCSISRSAS